MPSPRDRARVGVTRHQGAQRPPGPTCNEQATAQSFTRPEGPTPCISSPDTGSAHGDAGFGCDDTRGSLDAARPGSPPLARHRHRARCYPDRLARLHRPLGPARNRASIPGPPGPVDNEKAAAPHALDGEDPSRGDQPPGLRDFRRTEFFRRATAAGSQLYVRATAGRNVLRAAILAVVAILTILVLRTQWRPASPRPVRARRCSGQIRARGAPPSSPSVGATCPLAGLSLGAGVLATALQWSLTRIDSLSTPPRWNCKATL